ncbi:MAG TPA: hypothetical protein VK607_16675, partial [Kofleriaceae bacterium]|nr:hypothetical protein [Kofleriaceae bacterium]
MAKKQSDGEASAEAAGKRRPQKKTAAPRPGARGKPAKPPARPAKSSKPSRSTRPIRTVKQPPAQAELPIGAAAALEDAELVAGSQADAAAEAAELAAAAAVAMLAAEADAEAIEGAEEDDDDEDEEVIEVGDAPPVLSAEEQEIATLYGDDLAQPAIAHAEYADRQTADE